MTEQEIKVIEFIGLIDEIGNNLEKSSLGRYIKDNILLLSCEQFTIKILDQDMLKTYSATMEFGKRKIVEGSIINVNISFSIRKNIFEKIIKNKDIYLNKPWRLFVYFFDYLKSSEMINNYMVPEKLDGENTYLRRAIESDMQEILLWYIDNELNNLAGYAYTEPSIDKIRYNMSYSFGSDPLNLVIVKKEQDRIIGTIQLYDINERDRNCMMGIRIGNKFEQGKGFGGDAIKTIIKYVFEVMKLKRVSLRVYSYNENAIKCYLKIGFEKEGLLRNSAKVDGKYVDELLMSIINNDVSV